MKRDYLFPLRKLHGRLHEAKVRQHRQVELLKAIEHSIQKNPDAILFVLTPIHTNIGDHAIAFSAEKMLQRAGVQYIEITTSQIRLMMRKRCLHTMNGHPILINGGGNIGTIWPGVQKLQEEIIYHNPMSKIVVLPNSAFFENTTYGTIIKKRSQFIFNRHPNLSIYAREKLSYTCMHSMYTDVKMIPDLVLSLSDYQEDAQRNGCLICFREDREKTRTYGEEQLVRDCLNQLFGTNISCTDMHTQYGISPETREIEINRKLHEFSCAELVVTDRLHAMIFCAITGTPCIVVNSLSPKMRGCYEWIKELGYIRFWDDSQEFMNVVEQVRSVTTKYDNSHFAHYYDILIKEITALKKRE